MSAARWIAVLPVLAFGLLGGVLATVGAVSWPEIGLALGSVAFAFVPSGWCAPAGWRRRAAEASLLVVAWVLAMVEDPTMLRMLMPPILMVTAAVACSAAARRAAGAWTPVLAASFAIAVRLAGGLGLSGAPWYGVVSAVVLPAALAAAGALRAGLLAGALLGLVAAVLPLQSGSAWAGVALALLAGLLALPRRVAWADAWARGWAPGIAAAALVLGTCAPWGAVPAPVAFLGASWAFGAACIVLLLATPRVHPALAGAGWLAATLLLGPVQGPPPDVGAVELASDQQALQLPAGDGGRYVIEAALANGAAVPTGAPVATVRIGARTVALRAGMEVSEWAHERLDVKSVAAHPLPSDAVWRPVGLGWTSFWGVAGRTELDVPAGVTPVLERAPELPRPVAVVIPAVGPARPSPPRALPAVTWLLACIVAVGILQLACRNRASAVPWLLLTALSIALRTPVEPLGVIVERHGVDVVAAAFVLTWAPVAWRWLRAGRAFLPALLLLAPVALATPQLTPPLHGDEPSHLMIMRSIVEHGDVDIGRHFGIAPERLVLHSPVLAALLLPGFVIAGRTGALLLLALCGAAVVALLVRRARVLEVSAPIRAMVCVLLLTTLPLATISSQIWVEVGGALALAYVLAWRDLDVRGWVASLAATALAGAVKTRLALATFPALVFSATSRVSSRRRLVLAGVTIGAAATCVLVVGNYFLGHPFGQFRRVHHLIPVDPRQALVTLGGLLFDPAGGLMYSAPLIVIALAGVPLLWRLGSERERGALVGLALTVVFLLPSTEWYGGGAFPARYLAPFLPVLALALMLLLDRRASARRLVVVALPLGWLVWWVLVTRPQHSINPGNGGWWLSDAISRRFDVDARALFPSFLVIRPATYGVVIAAIGLGGFVAIVARLWPLVGARVLLGLARNCVAGWLVVGALGLAYAVGRTDGVVEIESPQVRHEGGRPEPAAGTWSMFRYPNGWWLHSGDGVRVPLHLGAASRIAVEGWFEGTLGEEFSLRARWDACAQEQRMVGRVGRGRLWVDAPGPGRHTLHLTLAAPGGGEAMLDRVVVER